MDFIRLLVATLTLVLFVVVCEHAIAQAREERKDPPEVEAIKRFGKHVFPLYSFREISTRLFDIGFLSAAIAEGPNARYLDMRLKLKSVSTGISFSFYIENRVYGSPAWDEVALPRTSLNIDPITGWFYFDK